MLSSSRRTISDIHIIDTGSDDAVSVYTSLMFSSFAPLLSVSSTLLCISMSLCFSMLLSLSEVCIPELMPESQEFKE